MPNIQVKVSDLLLKEFKAYCKKQNVTMNKALNIAIQGLANPDNEEIVKVHFNDLLGKKLLIALDGLCQDLGYYMKPVDYNHFTAWAKAEETFAHKAVTRRAMFVSLSRLCEYLLDNDEDFLAKVKLRNATEEVVLLKTAARLAFLAAKMAYEGEL